MDRVDLRLAVVEAALTVRHVVRHRGLWHLLVGHEGAASTAAAASRYGIRVSGHQDRRQDGRLDAGVVVGVDANVFLLGGEGKLTHGFGLEFVMRLVFVLIELNRPMARFRNCKKWSKTE